MSEPVWLLREALEILHAETIAHDGGAPGIRDEGLLESALARGQNAWNYGVTDMHELAASYAYGLARNHPFIDGNKRAAFLACAVFLDLNDWQLTVPEAETAITFFALAAGDLDEKALSEWLRSNSHQR